MSVPLPKTSFVSGEVSPAMYGHVDLARMQGAASTMRNGWPSFHGAYYSRAGTSFVGFSKQTGRTVPPRLIPFQFSINQGLSLEFGNQYMRVIRDGGFVTDETVAITGAANSDPLSVTVASGGTAAASAVPVNTSVIASYKPGDLVTLAGGSFSVPSVLSVTNTSIKSLTNSGNTLTFGASYAPADTIALTGGTQTTPAQVTVTTTTAFGNAVITAGSGGPVSSTVTLTGTTGTGTKFQAVGFTNSSGQLASLGAFLGGSYTVNPTNLANEPVTSTGGLTGAHVSLIMAVNTFSITNAGVFTANAVGDAFTQASTSGSGTGVHFQGLMQPHAVAVSVGGVYTSYPSNPVSQASTSGTGIGAEFTVTTTPIIITAFNVGDWAAFAGLGGMTQANGNTLVVASSSGGTLTFNDVYGNPVDATGWGAYTSGGTLSRIYTLPTIYAEADLLWLKVTESADQMSICCVNQVTLTEYVPQDLTRATDDSWAFTPAVPAPSVGPPAAAAASASSSGSVDYAYVVTSVAADGTESIASPIANVASAVNILATAGAITLTWSAVLNVQEYNIYKAFPAFSQTVPSGALFGYAGSSFGGSFVDGPSAVIPDLSQVPPTHQNPFARGQIIGANVTSSAGTVTSVAYLINTSTGSGAVLLPIIVNSTLVGINVEDNGHDYAPGDTVTLTVTGGGSATASLVIGAETGTYPGTVGYFQERRVYAYTINNPDTYFMSQPGAFTNFDTRNPPVDSDAITGSPWAVQVNGIQFVIQTAGGLLVFTGLQTWLLVGAGSFATNASAISPTSQDANPQPEVGCSPTLQPIKINYDVLFFDSNSQFLYDQPYQLYALSEPIDQTQLSTHLFENFSFVSHAWCRSPYKLDWAIRSDGVMLSFTFLKAEQIQGWARHDTQGLFQSNCAVKEPPVDALYLACQRFPPTYGGSLNTYTIERMDNRFWQSAEDVWAVDCGLQLTQPTPNATLTASTATGPGNCAGVTGLVGGTGYSAGTTASVVDANGTGPGTGAAYTLGIAGGVITSVVNSAGGANYIYPELVFNDPAGSAGGSGASARITLSNPVAFTASAPVFAAGNVGSFIRMGGGIAAITAYISSTIVLGDIKVPITNLIPGSTAPLSAPAGSWTMTAPVTSVSGLRHLAGLKVTGLADGNVVPPTTVDPFGNVALANPASAVTLGLGYQAQLQGVYLSELPVQGQRKKISDVTVRIQNSRGIKVGTNQVDGSTLSPPQLAPLWPLSELTAVPDKGRAAYNALCAPLYTGDTRTPVFGGYATPGQVACQQDNPLPMEVLAFVPEVSQGDVPQTQWPKREQKGQGG